MLGFEEGQGAVYEKVVEVGFLQGCSGVESNEPEVMLVQPLIRKCLDGYNGCVFCYVSDIDELLNAKFSAAPERDIFSA